VQNLQSEEIYQGTEAEQLEKGKVSG